MKKAEAKQELRQLAQGRAMEFNILVSCIARYAHSNNPGAMHTVQMQFMKYRYMTLEYDRQMKELLEQ